MKDSRISIHQNHRYLVAVLPVNVPLVIVVLITLAQYLQKVFMEVTIVCTNHGFLLLNVLVAGRYIYISLLIVVVQYVLIY